MTLQQIIKETESLSLAEQRNLLSYFILRLLNPDRNNLRNILAYNDLGTPKPRINKKRVWRTKGQIKLNSDLDKVNIRDYIYNDLYEHYE